MSRIRATPGHILFNVVKDALRNVTIPFQDDPKAILVWYDTIKDQDYWSTLKPFQIVNRLPNMNLLCRKAPFIRLLHRISPYFPNLYSFLPRSWILPFQNTDFIQAIGRHDRQYIVKPDNGSLGAGISIITKNESYSPKSYLAVAQEYIESLLIDSTKFDCRIYVLVASIDPLVIYVYRGGIARFCSQKVGDDSVYSQLTNTAVNRKNPGVSISSITRMVNDVFSDLQRNGINTDLIWKKIDAVAVLTVISAYSYLKEGQFKRCPNRPYSRCFQILGFDILIDRNLNPVILEVNYRPSLETDTNDEYNLKLSMLSDALRIMSPPSEIQQFIDENNQPISDFNYSAYNLQSISMTGNFVRVYPTNEPVQSGYDAVLNVARKFPSNTIGNITSLMPTILEKPVKPESLISISELLLSPNVYKQQILPPLDPQKSSCSSLDNHNSQQNQTKINGNSKQTNTSNTNSIISKQSHVLQKYFRK